jgi:hypothetical protein
MSDASLHPEARPTMAIDTHKEPLVPLARAHKLIPKVEGRNLTPATVRRWATGGGCRGVVLESTVVGGTRCTSREAMARFLAAVDATSPVVPAKSPRIPGRSKREARAVAG